MRLYPIPILPPLGRCLRRALRLYATSRSLGRDDG